MLTPPRGIQTMDSNPPLSPFTKGDPDFELSPFEKGGWGDFPNFDAAEQGEHSSQIFQRYSGQPFSTEHR